MKYNKGFYKTYLNFDLSDSTYEIQEKTQSGVLR